MKKINILFRTVAVYLGAIVFYILFVPFITIVIFFTKDKESAFLIITLLWERCLLAVAGVKITIKGKENLEGLSSPVVFIANHASYFDIPILNLSLPFGVRFVARDSLFKAPFLGWIMRNSGHFAVDRKGSRKTLKTILEVANQVKKGLSVIVFPEGKRSDDGMIKPFKKGSLFVADRAEALIVPVVISGSYDIMPRNCLFVNPNDIVVNIKKPFDYYACKDRYQVKMDDKEIMQKLYACMIGKD